jgi:general secretion pathway protein I
MGESMHSYYQMRQDKNGSGFTLLEVLVALAVFAIAIVAVIQTQSMSIDLTMELRDRSVALWVAKNRLNEHEINGIYPSIGEREGIINMANRQWYWQEKTSATDVADMRRVEIVVKTGEHEHYLVKLFGFVRNLKEKISEK